MRLYSIFKAIINYYVTKINFIFHAGDPRSSQGGLLALWRNGDSDIPQGTYGHL